MVTDTLARKQFRDWFVDAISSMAPGHPPWDVTHRHYSCRERRNNCYMSKMVHEINADRHDVHLKTTHIKHPNGNVTFGVSCFALEAE